MAIESNEVFVFGRWVGLREAKKILSGIQLPQAPSSARNFTDTSVQTCGWDPPTCEYGSTCEKTTCGGYTCHFGPCR